MQALFIDIPDNLWKYSCNSFYTSQKTLSLEFKNSKQMQLKLSPEQLKEEQNAQSEAITNQHSGFIMTFNHRNIMTVSNCCWINCMNEKEL